MTLVVEKDINLPLAVKKERPFALLLSHAPRPADVPRLGPHQTDRPTHSLVVINISSGKCLITLDRPSVKDLERELPVDKKKLEKLWQREAEWEKEVRKLGLEYRTDPKRLLGEKLEIRADRTNITIKERASGKELGSLRAPGASVRCLALDPDETLLASGTEDGSVLLWKLRMRKPRVEWEVIPWDLRIKKPRAEWHVHSSEVQSLAFSPDGKFLASGNLSEVKLWRVSDLLESPVKQSNDVFEPHGGGRYGSDDFIAATRQSKVKEELDKIEQTVLAGGRAELFIIENAPKRFASWRAEAEKGDSGGQVLVGACYQLGAAVKKDDTEAVRWYQKAANQDLPLAQHLLGIMYRDGRGVAAASDQAVKWFRKAAERNLALAQYNLGSCYEYGQGVGKDLAEAAKFYGKAAQQGHGYAAARLAVWHELGRGVTKSDQKARHYRERAKDKLGTKAAKFLEEYAFLIDPIGKRALEGEGFKLADYRDKVVVLWFTRSDPPCPPCRAMSPDMERMKKRLERQTFALLEIDVTFNKGLPGRWDVQAVPLVAVVDQGGVVRYHSVGYMGPAAVNKAVDGLLKKKKVSNSVK